MHIVYKYFVFTWLHYDFIGIYLVMSAIINTLWVLEFEHIIFVIILIRVYSKLIL